MESDLRMALFKRYPFYYGVLRLVKWITLLCRCYAPRWNALYKAMTFGTYACVSPKAGMW